MYTHTHTHTSRIVQKRTSIKFQPHVKTKSAPAAMVGKMKLNLGT